MNLFPLSFCSCDHVSEAHPRPSKPNPPTRGGSISTGSLTPIKSSPILNNGSPTILGKRTYEQHNGLDGEPDTLETLKHISACVCLVSVKECHLHRTPICHNHHRRLFPSAVVYIWQHVFVLAPLHPSSQICGKPKAGRAAAASRLSYRTEQAGMGVGCNVACRCAASVGRQKYISI